MIHIAPCSCELHVRIRELEAELDRYGVFDEMKARAEKAEARVAELEYALRGHFVVAHPEWVYEGKQDPVKVLIRQDEEGQGED